MLTSRSIPRHLSWPLAAVTSLALLGGCSDDGDDADPVDSSAPVPTTAPLTSESPPGSDGSPTLEVTPDDPVGGDAAVLIADYAFEPTPATVAVGTTVTWSNDDGFSHSSTADDEAWDSAPIEPGSSFEHTFDEPGTYAYHCAIHNFMTGEVVVE